ncbi:MAG: hypothetical protein O7I93_11880 [Gemmatimonadetes bacterium]|nr:hypothetical protein [Gemmatimonadota bacterium]
MTWLLGCCLMMQGAVWEATPAVATVGDTVWLERALVVTDPAARVRLGPLEASDLLEPLRLPEVVNGPTGLVARYTVALFEPGDHVIELPDVQLVYDDGRVETLVGGAAFVQVMSVLPDADSLPPPRASRAPIAQPMSRALPATLLIAGVLACTVGWGVARWRPRPRPEWTVTEDAPEEIPLSRWIAAGEPRAVATVTMNRVRGEILQYVPEAGPSLDLDKWLGVVRASRPEWPLRDLTDVARALERASFAPAIPSDVIALVDEAHVLLNSLAVIEAAPNEVEEVEEP